MCQDGGDRLGRRTAEKNLDHALLCRYEIEPCARFTVSFNASLASPDGALDSSTMALLATVPLKKRRSSVVAVAVGI